MTIPTKPLAVGGVILGGGAAATGGVLLANRDGSPTLRERLEKYLLPEKTNENKSLWVGRIGEAAKDEEINKLFTEDDEDKKITALFGWCQGKLDERASNEKLLEKFQTFCTYSIKEKMGEWAFTSTESQTHETEYKELVIKHKNNNETEQKLKDIKTQEEAKAWTTLKNWCEEKYKQGYEGDNDLWKLVNKFCKKPTIQDKLNGTELPEEGVDGDWGTKANTAKTNETTKKDSDLLTQLNDNSKNKTAIKGWCQKQYKEPFDKQVGENESKTSLLTDVKSLCALTIKEKLDADTSKPSVKDSDATTSWQKNAELLKNHNNGNNEPTLAFGLETMKNDNTRKDDLKKWCEKNWEKGYKGESDDLWKLANKFCRKNP